VKRDEGGCAAQPRPPPLLSLRTKINASFYLVLPNGHPKEKLDIGCHRAIARHDDAFVVAALAVPSSRHDRYWCNEFIEILGPFIITYSQFKRRKRCSFHPVPADPLRTPQRSHGNSARMAWYLEVVTTPFNTSHHSSTFPGVLTKLFDMICTIAQGASRIFRNGFRHWEIPQGATAPFEYDLECRSGLD
jgi:hypothetical protein